MQYVIRFIDPKGEVSYWPKGFGFTSHAHVADIVDAEQFQDAARAARSLNGYINPPAFWNSERDHAERMRQQFKRWTCSVIPLPYTAAA